MPRQVRRSADRGSATQGDVANVERVARSLFTDFLWPFEITAGLLVIAVVGSVVLARRSGQPSEMVEEDFEPSELTVAEAEPETPELEASS